MKVEYRPTKQSNAIGLAFLGFGLLFTTYGLYRYKVGPYLLKQRMRKDEEWADYIFEQEQKAQIKAADNAGKH
jgi:hypothetical protein